MQAALLAQASERAKNSGTTPGTGPSPSCEPSSGSETSPESNPFSSYESTSSNSQPDQDPSGTDSKADKTPNTSLANAEPAAPQTTGFLPLLSSEDSHGSTGALDASAGQLDGSQAEFFLRLLPVLGARAQMEQQTTHDEYTSKDDPVSVDDLPDLSNSVSTLSVNQTPSTPKEASGLTEDSVATKAQPAGSVLDMPKTSRPSKAPLKTTPVNQEHQRHQHHHKKPKPKGPPGNMFGLLGDGDDDDNSDDEEEGEEEEEA